MTTATGDDRARELRERLRRNPAARQINTRIQAQRLLRGIASTFLLDRDYYEAQRGVRFESDRAAQADFVAASRTGTWAPNILFEAQWFADDAVRASFEPLLAYVSGRRRHEPGPAFDERAYLAAHPEAETHPGRGLGHFLQRAGDDDLVPVPADYPGPPPTYGEARARLISTARRRAAERPDVDPPSGSSPTSPGGDPDPGGRHVVDWRAVEETSGARDAGVVSIVMPTYQDWRMTVTAVESVLRTAGGQRLEVLVVDNGSERSIASIVESRFVTRPEVRVLRQPRNLNFANGSNVGMAESTGTRVVFLNNDTETLPGWLDPLLAGLADPDVRGTQPLLVYPDGTIQSAGSLLPGGDSPPIALLAGYPPEDARRTPSIDLRIVTAAALAVRADEFAALRGFDPAFVNGQEDVDYCLRAVEQYGGHFRVATAATVIHHESRTPGRGARIQANRRLLVERWRGRLAADDPAAMSGTGLTITRWNPPADPRDPDDVRIPSPVVERVPSVTVQEGTPSLRWAITTAARPGPQGDGWGDTHFAAALTASLERLGQQVVVDRRDAYNRPTAGIDDVKLVLRGLEEVPVSPGRVNLLWVISHPDFVTDRELLSYQRVFAASESWAARRTSEGRRVLPLLQATDPARFHPGRNDGDDRGDVVFVGRSRNVLRPVVRDAVEAGVRPVIFGDGWETFELDHLVRATYLEPDDVAVAYASAAIVLNDHWADMARDGFLSNRLFDAVAAGARVVTDEVEADLSMFGGAVQIYHDIDELRALCGEGGLARFPDDAARREIAAEVGRQHSFDARARQLVDVAIQVRVEQGWSRQS